MSRIRRFFQESWSELKKVTWPTRTQVRNLTVLVFDNKRYGTIAMHQSNEQRDLVATDLGAIDFAAVARACGAQGGRVTRDRELEPALRDALAADRPAIIQLELDPRWVTPDRFEELGQPT